MDYEPMNIATVPMDNGTVPRKRRTNAELAELRDTIVAICRENKPLSVRQLFYLLVTGGHIDKTESGYERVIDLSGQLRMSGELPFGWIRDDSRRRMQYNLHKSPADAIRDMAEQYRYDYQSEQPVNMEVWCEKETLNGLLWPVCAEYRIDLLPCKGMPSLTYLYEASMSAKRDGRPFRILYVGDDDPTGKTIDPRVNKFMTLEYPPGVEWLGIERIAVTQQQRDELNLPTRPAKEKGAKAGIHGEIGCVEVEAIPPAILRRILATKIESYLDMDIFAKTRQIDIMQRGTMAEMAANLGATPVADEPTEPDMEIVLYELPDDAETINDAIPMNRLNPIHREFWGDGWAKTAGLRDFPPGDDITLSTGGRHVFTAQILRKNPMHLLLKRP